MALFAKGFKAYGFRKTGAKNRDFPGVFSSKKVRGACPSDRRRAGVHPVRRLARRLQRDCADSGKRVFGWGEFRSALETYTRTSQQFLGNLNSLPNNFLRKKKFTTCYLPIRKQNRLSYSK